MNLSETLQSTDVHIADDQRLKEPKMVAQCAENRSYSKQIIKFPTVNQGY